MLAKVWVINEFDLPHQTSACLKSQENRWSQEACPLVEGAGSMQRSQFGAENRRTLWSLVAWINSLLLNAGGGVNVG